MKVKPTIWVLFTAVLMSVGLTWSNAHARCSPANDYPLNRGESVSFYPTTNDDDRAPNAVSVAFNVTNVLCYGKKTGSVTAIPSGGVAPYTYAWSNGKTTQTINNLYAGSYSVTVTGAQGSGTATGTATVTQSPQIVAYINCTKTCPNQCNGTAAATVLSGGVPPLTYQWSTTATTSTITGLCAGTYWVTITDANGCKKIVGAIVLTYPAVSLSGIATNVSCNATCTGTITQTVSGGGGAPFVYNWSNGATTKNLSGLCAGQYCVTVTSSKGCTASACYTISQTTPPSVTLTPANPPCYGGTGSINATVSGGTGPYTYFWSNAAITEDISGLGTGSYSITVTDANGCTATATTSISVPTVQLSVVASATGCSPITACLGTATTAVSNGTAPYTYIWSNSQTGASAGGFCPGTYGVTVTDANQCTATDTVAIGLCPPVPCTFPITITGTAPCGATTAILGVNLSSVPAGYTATGYAWYLNTVGGTPVATTPTYVGTVGVTYCVRVSFSSANQECFAETCTTITPSAGPSVTITGNNPTCFGKNSGNATANVSGGTGPYTYVWSNGKTTQTVNNLVAGTYSVTVTDANGCTASDSHILTQPPQIIAYVNCIKTCPGQCSGIVNLSVMGGTPPYTYQWSNGATTQDLANVCAGIYWVTITDANGCKKYVGAQVLTYPVYNLSALLTQPTCAGACDGAVNITVSGGGGPGYTYNWSNGKTTQDITGLCGGAYTVTVTSVKGCTATATYNLNNPQPTTCTVTNDTICAGATGELCASPASSYIWSTGSTNSCVAVTDAGVYTVTTTDANGCTSICTGVLVVDQAPPCLISGEDFCYGDSTELCVATASSYLWSNGATTQCITVYTGGMYEVTVTYANGCTTTCDKYIQAYLPPVITTVPSDVTCAGLCNGSVTAYVTGDVSSLTYDWSVVSADSATLSNLCPGFYCVTVTDVNGCSAAACDSVEAPAPLTPTIILTDVTCNGACDGIGTAGAYGGTEPYTVLWSNGDTNWIADSLCAGNYTFTVTDILGCTVEGSLGISQPNPLLTIIYGDTVSCIGSCDGVASVTAIGGNINGPYSYEWSNGDTGASADSLCPGQYCVTVTDILGCTATACVTIYNPAPFTAVSVSSDVDCFNDATGTVSLILYGGTFPYTVAWDNGETTFTITDLVAGTYCYTVTDANGCTAEGCDTINEPEQLLALIVCPCPLALCPGDCGFAADLEVYGGTPPYTYEWSNGATTQDVDSLCEGMYSVTVTDANGCTFDAQTAPFEWADSIEIQLVSTNVSCYGECDGSAGVGAIGGHGDLSILWENGNTTWAVGDLCEGTYCFTITDELGCTAEGCVSIAQPDSLIITLTKEDVTCYGACDGSATISVVGGTGDYSYVWNTLVDLDSLCAGTYCVTVYDANQCSATACITIEQPTLLTVTSEATDVDCFNDATGSITVTANGGTPAYAIVWDNGETTFTITDLVAGTYCYTVTDANGCTATGCDTVNEPEQLLALIVCPCPLALCPGDCSFAADLEVYGGTPPYTYEWSNGATTQDVDSLCEGMYSVTVTDANGCTFDAQTAPFEWADSITAIVTSEDLNCSGVCDGSATVTPVGGYGDLSILWDNGASTWTIESLCAGEYCFTITDELGCTYSDCVTIEQPEPLIGSSESTDITCYGVEDGTITVFVSGGTYPFTYTWANGALVDSTGTGLGFGTYGITVTDANGCTIEVIDSVGEPEQLTVSISSDCVPIFCGGVATATASGGTGAYTYAWSNGDAGATADSLCNEIVYYVTITDANGCTLVDSVSVLCFLPPCEFPVTIDVFAPCGVDSAVLTLAGVPVGYETITYAWYNQADPGTVVSTAATFVAYAEGTYCVNVEIIDENGSVCLADTCAEVVLLGQPVATVVSTDETCFEACDGTATVTVTGVDLYGIVWSNGESTSEIEGLCPGDYCFTVTAFGGCVDSGCVTIEAAEPLLAISTCPTTILCYDDCTASINVYITGGTAPYSFEWFDVNGTSLGTGVTSDSTLLEGLCAGLYTILVTDVNGCTYDRLHNIEQPDAITADATTTADSCSENGSGTASVTAAGGTPPYSYLWSNGATDASISGLAAGTFGVTVTDANDCTATDEVEVIFIECPCAPLRTQTKGGWSQEPSGNNQGTYLYANFDGAFPTGIVVGCVSNYTLTLTSEVAVSTWLPSGSTPTALTQDWVNPNLGGNPDLNNNLAAQLVAATINVGFDAYDPNFGGGSQSLGGMIILSGPFQGWTVNQLLAAANTALGGCGTGGFTYSQYNEALTNVNENYKEGTVDNGFLGCDSVPACDLEASAQSTDLTCYGVEDGTITVSVTGGTAPIAYAWANGSTTAARTGLGFGTYQITVTDANGCEAIAEATIEEPTQIVATAVATDATVCIGACDGSIDLTVTGGTGAYTFNWSNGDATEDVDGLCPGDYSVTVTDENGCTATTADSIMTIFCVPCELPVSILPLTETCLQAGPLTLNLAIIPVEGGSTVTYEWSGGYNGASLDVTESGTYCVTVTVQAPNGTVCIGEDCIVVTVQPCCNVTDGGNIGTNIAGCDTVCPGLLGYNGILPSGGEGDIEYMWLYNTGIVNSFNASLWIAIPNSDTAYYNPGCLTESTCFIRCSRRAGCDLFVGESNILCITVAESPTVTASVTDASVCTGNCDGAIDITVNGGTSPFIYNWSNTTFNQDLTGLCPGDYSVTVVDAYGCTATTDGGIITVNCIPTPCGQLRTQTKGGWSQEPSGNNQGTYLYANFDGAFPTGIVVGCDANYTLTLTSEVAVSTWLPAGSTPAVLTQDWVNPNLGGNPDLDNNLAAQLVAATINVGFDAYDPNFGAGSQSLGGMYITSGDFAGWTVNQLLVAANTALGGCGLGGYTASEYNEALTNINENYHDGNSDNGFLTCTPPVSFRGGDVVVKSDKVSVIAYPNPFAVNATIEFTLANDDNVTLEVYNVTGQKVAELFNGSVNANQTYNVNVDGAQLADGMYIYRLVTSNDTYTGQLVRVKP